MKEDVFTDEQLWDEVLEVLNDNRRELTDEEVASLLQERKVFPLRYVVLLAVAAALAIGFFLWPKAGPSLSPPMGGRTPLSYGDLLSRNEALPPTGGAGRGATADEQPQVELLEIDMEAVHQQGEDLRMAMAAMNNELFEME